VVPMWVYEVLFVVVAHQSKIAIVADATAVVGQRGLAQYL
jgi:hypothetical protein